MNQSLVSSPPPVSPSPSHHPTIRIVTADQGHPCSIFLKVPPAFRPIKRTNDRLFQHLQGSPRPSIHRIRLIWSSTPIYQTARLRLSFHEASRTVEDQQVSTRLLQLLATLQVCRAVDIAPCYHCICTIIEMLASRAGPKRPLVSPSPTEP